MPQDIRRHQHNLKNSEQVHAKLQHRISIPVVLQKPTIPSRSERNATMHIQANPAQTNSKHHHPLQRLRPGEPPEELRQSPPITPGTVTLLAEAVLTLYYRLHSYNIAVGQHESRSRNNPKSIPILLEPLCSAPQQPKPA